MRFGILGPLLVHDGDEEVDVPAARQRVLLAALLVHAGQAVPADELAEAVWDGSPAAGAAATLRTYVMRLRRVLGPRAGARLVTRYPGYLVSAEDEEVDLLRFTRLYREGGAAVRAGAWAEASGRLAEALGLWRGVPLADISSEVLRRDESPRLEQLHLQALEWRAEAGLQLGCHGELIPELQSLAVTHPLRERFHAQLMLALYRCGRQAEALAAYQHARRVLIDELGTEPGTELRELHQGMLADDPALAVPRPAAPAAQRTGLVVPRELPGSVRHFVGRADELKELTRLLDRASEETTPGTVVISAIGGTAGVGKTALAVYWACRVAERFPDGQLYVNLRGFDASGMPMTVAEAVRGFLDALQVPAGQIPASLNGQTGLYRSLLAGRRMLVLLDNARDAMHVRPLLPGSPGCLVLVTSRSQLTGLVAAEGAHFIALDVPGEAEARELLVSRLHASRAAREPEAVTELIALCARLPLALAITAARIAASPALPLAGLATGLRAARDRLDALDAGDPATSVRAAFSWSYRQLSDAAARMFRLLGLHPGPDITVPAAASLAGARPEQALAALRELTSACLAAEHAPGRYACHDLLRVYAAEQARAVDDTAARNTAIRRVLDHYLHTARAAATLLSPALEHLALLVPQAGMTAEDLPDSGRAQAWLQAEHQVLVAAISRAAAAGLDTYAWQISLALADFLSRQGQWHQWAATQRTALGAAERLGDRAGQAYSHHSIGRASVRLGCYDEAAAHLSRAIELRAQLGDDAGQGRSLLVLAAALAHQGRFGEALGHARQSLDLFLTAGDLAGQSDALNGIGWDLAQLGADSQSLAYCTQALELSRKLGHRSGEANTWDTLGEAHRHLGHINDAITCYHRAAGLYHELGKGFLRAAALTRLGDACQAAADPHTARDAWQQALSILDDLRHPDAEQVRSKIRDLPAPGRGDQALSRRPL